MKLFLLLLTLLNINYSYSQQKEYSFAYWKKKYEKIVGSNIDSAFYCAQQALTFAKQTQNKKNIAEAYFFVGKSFLTKGNRNESLIWFKKSLEISQKNSLDSLVSANYDRIATVYLEKEKYSTSINYFYKGLKIAQNKKFLKLEADLLNGIADTYYSKNDFNNALINFNKSIKIAKPINYKKSLFFAHNGIGCLYLQTGKFDSAVTNLEEAILIANQLQDNNKIFQAYSNLVNTELNQNKIDFNKIQLQLSKMEKIALISNDNNKWKLYYSLLADFHQRKNEFSSAITYNLKAIDFAKKTNDLYSEAENYLIISILYENLKDFNSSVKYLKKHYNLKEQIQKNDNEKTFAEIQTKYDVEVKNSKIKSLTQEKEKENLKKKWIITISIGLILLLVLFLFIFRQRIKNQKLLRDKEQEIYEIEKNKLEQEAQFKKMLGFVEGQDGERNRIANEMHDGLAGKLSTLKMQLSYKNNELKDDDIKNSVANLDEILNELRAISHNLSQNFIASKTFCELFYHLKKDYESTKEIEVELILFPSNLLNQIEGEYKKHCYRITQELLNNTIKHANADFVSINFSLHEDELTLIYEDNGKGLSIEKKTGIGLKNIEERIQMMNGTMTIENRAQKGFNLLIQLPNPLNQKK